MSAAPFDVTPVITRLRELVPVLREVGTSADYSEVSKVADYPAPCAYVILAKEIGSAADPGNAPRGEQIPLQQFADVKLGVVVAVRDYGGSRGERVSDALRPVLGPIRAALMGWVPDVPGGRALQWVQGDLLDYGAGVALWADVFDTQHLIKNG